MPRATYNRSGCNKDKGLVVLAGHVPGEWGDPDLFVWSGFGDTFDQLMAQNIKGISILVERLYAG